MTESKLGPYASDMNEEEWRNGRRNDGTPIVQSGQTHRPVDAAVDAHTPPEVRKRPWTPPTVTSVPAPAHGLKASGAFIEGVHKEATEHDNDVRQLAVRVLRAQADIADLGAEAKRIVDSAVQQLDALKKLAKYDGHEATMRAHAAAYADLQTLVDRELVNKRGWTITSARDAFFKLFNDNVKLQAGLNEVNRQIDVKEARIKDLEARVKNLEDDVRFWRRGGQP